MSYETIVAVMSILCLFAVIIIALVSKVNCGVLGIAFAFILSFFVKGSNIIKGFNYSLFLNILAVSLLFSIAIVNGTMDLFTKKLVSLIKGNRKLIPILFFVVALILSAVGAATISAIIILCPLAASVARQQKVPYFLVGLGILYGTFAGGLSPISATGIIVRNTAATVGITVGNDIFIKFVLAVMVVFVIMYIVLGGWKLKKADVGEEIQNMPSFTKPQWLTLGGIALFVVGALIFQFNVTAIGFFCSALLLLLHVADEKKAMAGVSWSILVLLGGMGILISMIAAAGGIDLLTSTFSKFMNPKTAAPIMCLISGFMSFVSSASGVVLPTLIPMLPPLAESSGASPLLLVAAICLGSHVVAVSSLSTGGGIMLGFSDPSESNKLFSSSVVIAIAGLVISTVISFSGLIA